MSNVEYVIVALGVFWGLAGLFSMIRQRGQRVAFERHVEQALQITRPLGPTGEFWCGRCARLVTDPLAHIVKHPGD